MKQIKEQSKLSKELSALRKKTLHSRWQKAVTVMAALVLFCTVYAMILPAAAITGDQAEAEPGIELDAQIEAPETGDEEKDTPEDGALQEDDGSDEEDGEEPQDGADSQANEDNGNNGGNSDTVIEIVSNDEGDDGNDQGEPTNNEDPQNTGDEGDGDGPEVTESSAQTEEPVTTEPVETSAPAEGGEGGEPTEASEDNAAVAGGGSGGGAGGGSGVVATEDGITVEETKTEYFDKDGNLIESDEEGKLILPEDGQIYDAAGNLVPLDEEGNPIVAEEEVPTEPVPEVVESVNVSKSQFFVGNLRYKKKDDYRISVAVPEEAEIPRGAKLKVRELEQGSDEYNEHLAKAEEQVLDGSNEIQFARFFDISIMVGDEKVEPAEGVNLDVTITYANKLIVPDDGAKLAVHFRDEENIEVLEATGEPEVRIEAEDGEEAEVTTEVVNEEAKSASEISEELGYVAVNASGQVVDPEDIQNKKTSVDEDDLTMVEDDDEDGMFVEDAFEGESDLYRFSFSQDSFSVVGTVITGSIGTRFIDSEGETWEIVASFGPEAEIPYGATLEVVEITRDELDYEQYYKEARVAAAAKAGKVITEEEAVAELYAKRDNDEPIPARFFDITILDVDKNEVHPAAPVQVEIILAEENNMVIAEDADITTVHFGEEGTEVLDSNANFVDAAEGEKLVDSVTFEANSFSVYAIVEGEIITERIATGSGETVEVTTLVTNAKDIARLAAVKIDELSPDSKAYSDAYEAVIASKSQNEEFDEDGLGFFAVDIKLLDKDGQEFEPEGTVSVSMKVVDLPVDEETLLSTVEIQHLIERDGEIIDVETVANSDAVESIDGVLTAEFMVDSFSTFTLTWTGEGSGEGIPEDEATTTLTIMEGDDEYATVDFRFVDIYGHNVKSPFDSNISGKTPVEIETVLTDVQIEGYEYQGAYYDSYNSEEDHGDTIAKIAASRTEEEREGESYQAAGQVNNGSPQGGNWRDPNEEYYRFENGQYIRIWWNRRGGGGAGANNYYFYNNQNGSGNNGRFTGTAYYYAGSSSTTYYTTEVVFSNNESRAVLDTVTSDPTPDSGAFATGKEIYLVYRSTNDDLKKATIHWGTYDGEDFVELKTPIAIDATASSINLDVIIGPEIVTRTSDGEVGEDGWYYVGAQYQEKQGADKQDLSSTILHKTEDVWQVKIGNQSVNIADGSNIYVNYAPIGSGGYTPPTPKPEGVEGPETTKNVTANEDGTFTIQLDVEGHEDQTVTQIGANVIVVMDITQSMTNNMPGGGGSRMAAAKTALNTLITTLNPDTNLINFSAVNFGVSQNGATIARDWTTEKADMTAYVSSLPNNPGDYGTNWKAGLLGGIGQVEDAEASPTLKKNDTYVIFVTDGNPNCYTDNYGGWHGSTGPGFNQNAYNAAVDPANTLGATSHFYGVFVGDDDGYDHLEDLITNAQGEDVINGSSTSAVEEAFRNIAQTIVDNIGAGNVVVDDGIPTLASVSANVAVGEAGGFEYYVTPKDGTQTAWADAPGASYSNANGVTWNLSDAGTLKDGWIYTLKFTVWPSQAAYDLIADLNNGLVEFDNLTEEQKKSIDGSEETGYTMKTNTHLYTTFKDLEGKEYIEENELVSDDMELPTETITITKKWQNPVDSHIGDDSGQGVQLYLTKDGENYLYGEHAIVVGPDPKDPDNLTWESEEEIYISCGNISQDNVTKEYVVHEPGHDYAIAEPPEFAYYWDLTADVYHPMVINGTAHYLIKNEEATGTDGVDYYIIKGQKYVLSDSGDHVLTATNDRRSSLNVFKAIDDQSDDHSADADKYFEYSVQVSNCFEDIYFDAWADGEYQEIEGENIVQEMKNGSWSGWYYAEAGEDGVTSFTMKVKAGWSVYFANLPKGTTYSIQETDLEEGWEFEKAEGVATKYISQSETVDEKYKLDTDEEDAMVGGSISDSNHLYTVTITNKWKPSGVSLTVVKSWNSGDFVTTHGDVTVALFRDTNGDEQITADDYITDSERIIASGSTSVTYDGLSSLDGLVVREVVITTETTGEGDSAVTTKTVTPVDADNVIEVSGETTSVGSDVTNTYVVTYASEGTETERTDTVTNTLVKVSIEMTKIGDWTVDNTLSDVKFKLFSDEECTTQITVDSEGEPVGTEGIITTDDEGKASVGTFRPGTYYLKEVTPADGYNILTNAIPFTIKEDGTVDYSTGNSIFDGNPGATYETEDGIGIYINNLSGAELPMTGGHGTLLYTLGGLLLMLGSAMMYGFRMRRRERRYY